MTTVDSSTGLAPIAERAAAPASLPSITAGSLTWRPAVPDDAPALLALRNTIAETDDEPYRESIEEITELFEAPWRRFDTDSLVGVDGEGRLRAYGTVESMPGDTRTVRAFLFGGVHPQVRGQGIGRELFAWQVARGRQVLAASGKDLPARLAVMAEDDGPASKARLYERAGFTPRRFYSDLRRDLRDLVAAPLPDVTLDGSLRLVPFAPELDDAARLAHNDAFRDHWGSEPQTAEQWTSSRSAFVPAWSFLVLDDAPDVDALLADADTDAETAASLRAGEPLVVGYQMADRFDEDFAVRGYSFGYTALLGTRRAYRGRKAAVAALAAGMRAMAADGMEFACLDVDTANPSGAHGMYAGLGYEFTHGSRMLSIEL
ncbi:ribosomal protein S18 acetylase RimI-like enzyme [Isoptericola sp. CG 20/1183]|uniref:Ribosomal protein S18 acetylase RimI-like enzyme n=1 Tax=Isoptericola halotolerans TaxID=300560 RepID=A0ABX5EAG8_9MICO|nr:MULTISPECIES: GNAT family N-acetyltransferase [Isoptericola]PRZ03859.1 ribosomal protein S18 acetylase RimI-like enzyme [Isoptericola sp. CG 20/1183]PRZ04008.1 ribosomal protein S18 acetylase RimI-like enzyme [Isoptericola halotolerans]